MAEVAVVVLLVVVQALLIIAVVIVAVLMITAITATINQINWHKTFSGSLKSLNPFSLRREIATP